MAGGQQPAVVPLRTIALHWTRIGLTGFGGPPTHVALLHRLVVDRRRWLSEREFEDAVAACNLLPGPASTQIAIFCALRLGGRLGAIVGGLGFIAPAVVVIVALSSVFLAHAPPPWVRGAGAGAGAAVAPVAARAALMLLVPSWRAAKAADRGAGSAARMVAVRGRASRGRSLRRAGSAGRSLRRARWLLYVTAAAVATPLLGPYLVLVLLGAGALELIVEGAASRSLDTRGLALVAPIAAVGAGGIGALAWVALKVGALSFGGGFVIVPLMQADAVHTYHWMSSARFLDAVALGQVTPGPVVATVAAVGYAAHGFGGAALAAAIAFLPSFVFVLLLGASFARLRSGPGFRAFLDGSGPAAIGAILGAAIPLTAALREGWQFVLLAAAAAGLLIARIGVVPTLVGAGVVGAAVGLAGGPVPR